MIAQKKHLDHSWVEVDLKAFDHNVDMLAGMARNKGKHFMVMVKANAYGHGLTDIARRAAGTGARFLGVGHIREALLLREQGIITPILLFTEPPAAAIPLLRTHNITAVAGSLPFLRQLLAGEPPAFHIKINTGLNRFGFHIAEAGTVCALLAERGATPEGILTHYSSAPDDDAQTAHEYARFREALHLFSEAGHTPAFIHASNSAATAWHTESGTNLVRLGLAAYGLQPNPERPLPLQPVLSWHTHLAGVMRLAPGERVGYGGVWTAKRDSIIGVIPAGYSDGFRRGPHNQQVVLAHGKYFPIVGNVMMNHAMIDMTGAAQAPQVGDPVTLLGTQKGETITAEAIADTIGTINEEVTTTISPLLRRYYYG